MSGGLASTKKFRHLPSVSSRKNPSKSSLGHIENSLTEFTENGIDKSIIGMLEKQNVELQHKLENVTNGREIVSRQLVGGKYSTLIYSQRSSERPNTTNTGT